MLCAEGGHAGGRCDTPSGGSSASTSSCRQQASQRRRRRRRSGGSQHTASTLSSTLLLLSLANVAAAQGLSFIWYFAQQNDASIPQCGTLDISIGPLDNVTTAPVPPYYLISYPAGATPSTFDASSANGGVYSWTLGYPSGTQFMLGMVDSQGNSGGIVRVYSVGDGATNCPTYQTANNAFTFGINPAAQPRTCQDVDFAVTGGVPPYTVTTAISMDTAINQTFTNSSISVKNTLSGGAAYILALSDSTGSYAASSNLIFSGGGGDNSCLVTTPSTSGRPTKTATADKDGTTKSPAIIGSVVAVCAVLLVAAGVAFLMYRRRKKAQHQSLLVGRLSGMGSGGGSAGSDSDTYKGSGNGREKFNSPMGGGGGMWRPESPTEYPGITSAPVRFRVTNPDDDARSERSFRMGGLRAAGGGGRGGGGSDVGLRASEDTVRSGSTGLPWSTNSGEHQYANERSQRQSLIESDANALYPPSSYRGPNGSPRSRFGASTLTPGGGGGTSSGSTGSFEDADQPWPTYSSAASSETEDHYTDLPASSAGILAMHRGRMNSVSSNTTGVESEAGSEVRVVGGNRGRLVSDEMDVEEMYRDEVYSRELHSEEMDIDPAWDSLTRPGMTSSPSQAYGSPFADSQRIRT